LDLLFSFDHDNSFLSGNSFLINAEICASSAQKRINLHELKSFNFSLIFSSVFIKPSLCASPIIVKMPIVGSMMSAKTAISFVIEIPASNKAKLLSDLICQTDKGTPVFEL
jgi:hypothetical protein